MIQITKDEFLALRHRFGDSATVAITNRQKKGGRKKYYAEESSRVMHFISDMRRAETERGVTRG